MASRYFRLDDKGLILKINLVPNSTKDAFIRLEQDVAGNDVMRFSVNAVPEKGRANKSLIELLSKKLRLPKTSIRLIAGEQSRRKQILIEGCGKNLCEAVENYIKTTGSEK